MLLNIRSMKSLQEMNLSLITDVLNLKGDDNPTELNSDTHMCNSGMINEVNT